MHVLSRRVFETSRDLNSLISLEPHPNRSQVRLLRVPKLSYLSIRLCSSSRTSLHPSTTIFRWACVVVGRDCEDSVSSASLSTACKDKTSVVMFLKLSGASLQDLYTFHASLLTAMKSPTLKPKLMSTMWYCNDIGNWDHLQSSFRLNERRVRLQGIRSSPVTTNLLSLVVRIATGRSRHSLVGCETWKSINYYLQIEYLKLLLIELVLHTF